VGGNSMSPNYPPGTWVYTAPISTPLERGDVVVIDDGHPECAIKRIVGLPGEMVHLKHGYVFINRRILLEPYVPRKVYTFPREREGVCILGENEYFVLGDNRPSSTDSRTYGPISRAQVKRRISVPEGSPRAHFGPNFLPACEAVLPQHTVSKVSG
jgi:signal peptidase I